MNPRRSRRSSPIAGRRAPVWAAMAAAAAASSSSGGCGRSGSGPGQRPSWPWAVGAGGAPGGAGDYGNGLSLRDWSLRSCCWGRAGARARGGAALTRAPGARAWAWLGAPATGGGGGTGPDRGATRGQRHWDPVRKRASEAGVGGSRAAQRSGRQRREGEGGRGGITWLGPGRGRSLDRQKGPSRVDSGVSRC